MSIEAAWRDEPPGDAAQVSGDTLGRAFDAGSNGITALRLALALTVVFSHAFKLGGLGRDPAEILTGGQTQLGGVAVTCFFVLSGFLLARSRERSGVTHFLSRRFLRIVPGLWVCLLVTAFVLAPFGSILGNTTYTVRSAGEYVAGNAGIVALAPFMGDLFLHNPWSLTVNGSLWTLTPEILCYLGLAIIPARSLRLVAPGLLVALSVMVLVRVGGLYPDALAFGHPLAFVLGMTAYLYRDRLRLTRGGLALAVAWVIGVSIAGVFDALAVFGLGYLLLWAAVRLPFRPAADLSYGVYIYAFPLQQILAAAGLYALGFAPFLMASAAASMVAGWLSWNLVERRAFRLNTRRTPGAPVTSSAPALAPILAVPPASVQN